MTAEKRIANNPDAVKRREQATAQRKQLEERLARLRARAPGDQPDEDEAGTPEPPFAERDVRFTPDEVDELERLVPGYFRAIGRRPSPRAIRTLLFKIQLFRLLMQLRLPGRPLESFSILSILDAFQQATQNELVAEQEHESVAIARQVV